MKGPGILITERVELVDSASLWVIAAFSTMHAALNAQNAYPRATFVRYIDGPTCADCDQAPVAHTERGLRCVTHLEMDARLARSQHPSR